MIYLERIINYKDGVMLLNAPVSIFEGDKDITVEFKIRGLDIHFRDKIINYKLALISENNVVWSEQNTVLNGRFILDIPDNLEVCNHSLLIQLIDSEGDSVITLSIIKDFLIVNERVVSEGGNDDTGGNENLTYIIEEGVPSEELTITGHELFCKTTAQTVDNLYEVYNEGGFKFSGYAYYKVSRNFIISDVEGSIILYTFNTIDLNKLLIKNGFEEYIWNGSAFAFSRGSNTNNFQCATPLKDVITNCAELQTSRNNYPDYFTGTFSYQECLVRHTKSSLAYIKCIENSDLTNYSKIVLDYNYSVVTANYTNDTFLVIKEGDNEVKKVQFIPTTDIKHMEVTLDGSVDKTNLTVEIQLIGFGGKINIQNLYLK